MVEIIVAPRLGLDAMMDVAPLLDAELEVGRLSFAIETLILADKIKAMGLGVVDDAKLDAAATVISEAEGRKAAPEAAQVNTAEFLPEMTDGKMPGLQSSRT